MGRFSRGRPPTAKRYRIWIPEGFPGSQAPGVVSGDMALVWNAQLLHRGVREQEQTQEKRLRPAGEVVETPPRMVGRSARSGGNGDGCPHGCCHPPPDRGPRENTVRQGYPRLGEMPPHNHPPTRHRPRSKDRPVGFPGPLRASAGRSRSRVCQDSIRS